MPTDNRPEKKLYSVPDVAHMLNVSPRTVWNLLSQGKLHAVHIGRRRLITANSVEALAAAGTEAEAA